MADFKKQGSSAPVQSAPAPTVQQAVPPAPTTPSPSSPPTATCKSAPRVFEVSIPHCLLGTRTFIAEDGATAFAAYKKLGGINGSDFPEKIVELSVGSKGYQAAVAAPGADEANAVAAVVAEAEAKAVAAAAAAPAAPAAQ